MKTSSSALEALFDLLAAEMQTQLQEGKTIMSKTGEAVQVSPDAATLNTIRQFLKDQGINCIGAKADVLRGIVDQLPFDTDIDDETTTFN